MQGFYGSIWVDRWRSGEIDGNGRDRGLLNAKATWCLELGGLAEQPARISKALEACRHRAMPPTLPEFLDLCRQAHVAPAPALAAPAVPPEVRAQRSDEISMFAKTFGRPESSGVDHQAWARKILAKPKDFPAASLKLAKEALDDNG